MRIRSYDSETVVSSLGHVSEDEAKKQLIIKNTRRQLNKAEFLFGNTFQEKLKMTEFSMVILDTYLTQNFLLNYKRLEIFEANLNVLDEIVSDDFLTIETIRLEIIEVHNV